MFVLYSISYDILKSKYPEYSDLLDTPRGRSYEASVGSTAVIKQFASLFSDEPDDSDGSSTGLNCLPLD